MEDFTKHLQNELLLRCRQQQGFSIRSFAKQLQVDPGALSRILAGKRKISKSMLLKMGQNLGLSPAQLESFVNKGQASSASPKKIQYEQVTHDAFEVFSNWYYLAILELAHTTDFKPENKWVAMRLGLNVVEVNLAVELLQRLNFLKIADGVWTDQFSYLSNIEENVTSTAHKNLQKQILQKAIAAVDEVPIEQRSQTALTFAVDPEMLGQARERIAQFSQEMNQLMQRTKRESEVYQLAVSLFPLTKKKL